MAWATSPDGTKIAYYDLGGEGPLLLMAHATGFHAKVWEPIAARLSDSFHCVALDLRAHGDSVATLPRDYNWSNFGSDVLAVVDELNAQGPILGVGHSKGGAALMLAEEQRPGTFRALWCFEPIVFPTVGTADKASAVENPMAAGARKRRDIFASREEAFTNYNSKPPFGELDEDVLWAYVNHGFNDLPDGTIQLKCRGENEAIVYTTGGSHGLFERLGSLQCPITVVRGNEGHPAEVANLVAEALPNGTLEVHDDLGHFGPLIDPERFAGRIRAAFAGLD